MATVVVSGAMLMKRANTGPVSGEPSAFFATGTVMVCTFAPRNHVALPAADHAHVTLRRPGVRPPCRGSARCTTARRLDFDMSTGFEIAKVAEYSTIPRALRGASWMSVMMALCGSFGSSSP